MFLLQDENPNYPFVICSDCRELVTASFILKVKYGKTTEILRNSFLFVKHEPDEDKVCITTCNISYLEKNTNIQEYQSSKKDDLEIAKKAEYNEILELGNTKSEREYKTRDCRKIPNIVINVENNKKEMYTLNTSLTLKQTCISFKHLCPICLKKMESAFELRKHAYLHKTLKHYFNVKKLQTNAMFIANPPINLSVYNRNEIIHQCPTCKESLTVENFFQHVNAHKIQEFDCEKCSRIFRKKSHLNIHKVRAHLEEYPFKCEVCNKGFVIERNYDCHILIHMEKDLPHKCEYCSKKFSNPEHLHRHLFIHTENITYGLKYKVKRCNVCKRSFPNIHELQEHRVKCTRFKATKAIEMKRMGVQSFIPLDRSKEFQCLLCSRSYYNIEGLEIHNRTKHKNDEYSKILCTMCGKCVSNIYIHMAGHAGEKPYKCHLCPKTFATSAVLKQHLLVHSGEKPFICSICGKTFNNFYNLQVHERIHKGDRCHKCIVCGKGFLEKSYLNKHMKTHRDVK